MVSTIGAPDSLFSCVLEGFRANPQMIRIEKDYRELTPKGKLSPKRHPYVASPTPSVELTRRFAMTANRAIAELTVWCIRPWMNSRLKARMIAPAYPCQR